MARFGRLRLKRSDKPKRLLMGIHPVPTMVTLGNLLCGFGAIVLAMRANQPPSGLKPEDCMHIAGLLIFVAMIFDVLDGTVARWTKSTSRFGMEMDSLCDVVSFGVAPAVLVKAMIDQQLARALLDPTAMNPMLDRYVYPMLAVYVCCAAMRLARYNVEADTGHRDFFFGMPSPGAAGCVASLVLLIIPAPLLTSQFAENTRLEDWRRTIANPVLMSLPFIMLVLGVLMVSRVHYPHIGERLLRGKKSFMHFIVLGLALVLIVMHHEVMLALTFNGYMLIGLLNEVRYQFFPSHRPAGWMESTEPSATLTNPDGTPTVPSDFPPTAPKDAGKVKESPAP
jgi:CDP-diacylglycerol---serine O-phosphatidyltransferase